MYFAFEASWRDAHDSFRRADARGSLAALDNSTERCSNCGARAFFAGAGRLARRSSHRGEPE
jgi:hypothetical protein